MATTKTTLSAETQAVLDKLSNHLYAHCGFAEATVNLTVGYIRRASPTLGMNPSQEDVERYIAKMRQSGQSYGQVSNAIRAVERFMEFLGRPSHLKQPRKPTGANVQVLSEAKISVMLSKMRNLREKTMLAVMAYSGIRNKELCCLRIRDVHLAQQAVYVECGKNSKGRMCCVPGDCIEILFAYLAERKGGPDDYLFVTVRHRHQLQTQDVRKFVRVAAKRAGVEGRVWPHLFRHSLATSLLSRGASVYSIQALLGHTFISTTLNYYLHPNNRNIRADYNKCAPSFV